MFRALHDRLAEVQLTLRIVNLSIIVLTVVLILLALSIHLVYSEATLHFSELGYSGYMALVSITDLNSACTSLLISVALSAVSIVCVRLVRGMVKRGELKSSVKLLVTSISIVAVVVVFSVLALLRTSAVLGYGSPVLYTTGSCAGMCVAVIAMLSIALRLLREATRPITRPPSRQVSG